MKNLVLDRKVYINAFFEPEEWGLFEKEGSEEVAIDLNKKLEFYVNKGYKKEEVITKMMAELKKHKKFGSYDSEPIRFLEKIVEYIFY